MKPTSEKTCAGYRSLLEWIACFGDGPMNGGLEARWLGRSDSEINDIRTASRLPGIPMNQLWGASPI